ncbi:MAG: HEAT repeat domain-containing protein [Planctomycetes bacterium]|nr:HEAT repeat domain-containing protein [Planctomycetota bacterium]
MNRAWAILVIWLAAGVIIAQEPRPVDRALSELLREARLMRGEALDGQARKIIVLGDAAIPGLCDALSSGSYRVSDASDERSPLTESQSQVLIRSVKGLPLGALPRYLGSLLDDEQSGPAQRLSVLRLCAIAGNPDLFPVVVRVAKSFGRLERKLPAPRASVATALGAIFRRGVAVEDHLGDLDIHEDDFILAAIVEALSGLRTRRSEASLLALLGRSPDLDHRILTTIARGSSGTHLSERSRAALATNLKSPTTELRAMAALAAGELRDFALTPQVIALLDDESHRVRLNALRSLRAISSLQLDQESQTWLDWYHGELNWLEDAWPGLIETIYDADESEIIEITREVRSHPALRDSVSRELCIMIPRVSEVIGSIICRVIGELGSREVVEDLIALLDNESALVQVMASQALVRITGRQAEASAEAWKRALDID